jgi:ferredoxin
VFAVPAEANTALVLVDKVTDPEQIALVKRAERECPTWAISVEKT